MIRCALVLLLLLALPAHAAPVRVKSGEHDGFTRMVLDFGAPVDWTLGRSEDGYDLHIEGPDPGFDLTEAFRLIGKSRLAAIWADPQTKDLRLGIACACHAIPFEFRPGIIVIDLRDGPPPKGSSFERALDGSATNALASHAAPRPRPRPASVGPSYDWTENALADLRAGANAQDPKAAGVLPSSDPALQPMREALLHDLSAGAAAGVIDLALPAAGADVQSVAADSMPPFLGLTLGDLPGMLSSPGRPDHTGLTAVGAVCIPAAALDFAQWAGAQPPSAQIADARAGLVAEFDTPDVEALKRAARFYLAIGFGAEARQLLMAFSTQFPEKPVLISLSHLVDGEAMPQSAFAGQAACDTPAALWSILADPGVRAGDVINSDAAVLAFSDLPPQLRRHLGPTLVERFVALGDASSTEKIRNAILRLPGQAGPEVALMQANLEMARGDPAAAQAVLEPLVAESGPQTTAALIALAEARTAQNLPVAPDMVVALQSLVQEIAGTPEEDAALRALIWAHAAAGQFDAAFAGLPERPDAEPRVWRLLAVIGSDDAVLAHAVLAAESPSPQADAEVGTRLAQRLHDLGMANAALQWAQIAQPTDAVLLARIHLQRHDGRAALQALAEVPAAEAASLRAKALIELGESAAAATLFSQAGDPDAELQALAGAEDWGALAVRGAEPWKAVAANLIPPPSPTGEGPLARAQRFADASTVTQTQVAQLLAAIAAP